jgi:hypothetical protein
MCPVDFTTFQFLSELSSCSVAAASRSGSRSAAVPMCWIAYSLIAWCKAFRSRPFSRVSESTNASTSATRSGGSLFIFSINSCCSTDESIAWALKLWSRLDGEGPSCFLAVYARGWTVYGTHDRSLAIFRTLNHLDFCSRSILHVHDFWISSESANSMIRN